MNKTELVAALAEKTALNKKQVEDVLNNLVTVVTDTLKAGDKVQIVGFLSAEVKDRPERVARNPSTGEPITIAASKAPVFKAGKSLRDAINGK